MNVWRGVMDIWRGRMRVWRGATNVWRRRMHICRGATKVWRGGMHNTIVYLFRNQIVRAKGIRQGPEHSEPPRPQAQQVHEAKSRPQAQWLPEAKPRLPAKQVPRAKPKVTSAASPQCKAKARSAASPEGKAQGHKHSVHFHCYFLELHADCSTKQNRITGCQCKLPQFRGGMNERVVLIFTYGFWNSKSEKLLNQFETKMAFCEVMIFLSSNLRLNRSRPIIMAKPCPKWDFVFFGLTLL